MRILLFTLYFSTVVLVGLVWSGLYQNLLVDLTLENQHHFLLFFLLFVKSKIKVAAMNVFGDDSFILSFQQCRVGQFIGLVKSQLNNPAAPPAPWNYLASLPTDTSIHRTLQPHGPWLEDPLSAPTGREKDI
jgi:hypothetical protein